jgi:hypothetical protein
VGIAPDNARDALTAPSPGWGEGWGEGVLNLKF